MIRDCEELTAKPATQILYILSHTYVQNYITIITGFSMGESTFECLTTLSNRLQDERDEGQLVQKHLKTRDENASGNDCVEVLPL